MLKQTILALRQVKFTFMNYKVLIYFLGLISIFTSCSKSSTNSDKVIYNQILKSQTQSVKMWRKSNSVDLSFFIPPPDIHNQNDTDDREKASNSADSINTVLHKSKLIILLSDSSCRISAHYAKTIEAKDFTRSKHNKLITDLVKDKKKSPIDISLFDPLKGYILANTKDLEKYVKDSIIITKELCFSNITYSKDGKTACVYLSSICGTSCGSGSLFVLEQKDNNWVIIEEINLWVA